MMHTFLKGKFVYMILSDSEEKSRTKSNTKEFQSTRDPREFTLITLKIQYVFHTLINSCFIWYGHILGNFIEVQKIWYILCLLYHECVGGKSSFMVLFMIIVASVFSSSLIQRSISSASN